MTSGQAVLLALMRRYLAAVMDPFVTLLEIHKLMYFMQEGGENLKLQYAKGHYGPYAKNLRHVLNEIEGHFISGYGDAEDHPERQIELDARASERAETFLQSHPGTHGRFERVAELIEGFETPYGMELLSTVHWVAAKEGATDVETAVRSVYAWNERKKMFTQRDLRLGWDVLAEKGWLNGTETRGAPS